jgi:small multidrug resistance pump
MTYVLLAIAIACEVVADTLLEYSRGLTVVLPSVLTFVFFAASLVIFSQVLLDINLSVAYATWCASGIVATTAISLVVFHDQITLTGAIGVALLVAGVVMVNLGSASGPSLP